MTLKKDKRMAIISGYFDDDSCGLLGPQLAATIIQEQTEYECIVIAVGRKESREEIKAVISNYFDRQRPVLGFSTLHGRPDLFALAGEITQSGAMTILAGPQAASDYWGEEGAERYPSRFVGLVSNFVCALHGPAEQIIPFLNNLGTDQWYLTPGLQYRSSKGDYISNPVKNWDERFFIQVNWGNLYRVEQSSLVAVRVDEAQVIQQIGCPYAARERLVQIDYPVSLAELGQKRIKLPLKGCSFCDVAVDKGFYGSLDPRIVIEQIRCLPELQDGRKIPFELINENPLPYLDSIIKAARENFIYLSQINLTMRADWFVKGQELIRQALDTARELNTQILLASVGFESFEDRLLHNLNKGLDVRTNIQAVNLMRTLKKEAPENWKYARQEGGIHGLIHPTPWDSREIEDLKQGVIYPQALHLDILPDHSIPLIIHHASGLGQWIREIELSEGISFARLGGIIAWWDEVVRDKGSCVRD